MDQQDTDIRLSQWEQIVIECSRASVTKREWCRQNGISERAFFYWQRKIRRKAAEGSDQPDPEIPARPPERKRTGFVELQSAGTEATEGTAPAHAMDAAPGLVIRMNHCSIHVSAPVQESTLRTVIKAVMDA